MTHRQTDIRFAELLAVLEDAEMTGDPLSAVELLERASRVLSELLVNEVCQARMMGHSWEQLGQALLITRQAAWQRYSGLPAVEPPACW